MPVKRTDEFAHRLTEAALPRRRPKIVGDGDPCGAHTVKGGLDICPDCVRLGRFMTRQTTVRDITVSGVNRCGVGRQFLVDGQCPMFVAGVIATITYTTFVNMKCDCSFKKITLHIDISSPMFIGVPDVCAHSIKSFFSMTVDSNHVPASASARPSALIAAMAFGLVLASFRFRSFVTAAVVLLDGSRFWEECSSLGA